MAPVDALSIAADATEAVEQEEGASNAAATTAAARHGEQRLAAAGTDTNEVPPIATGAAAGGVRTCSARRAPDETGPIDLTWCDRERDLQLLTAAANRRADPRCGSLTPATGQTDTHLADTHRRHGVIACRRTGGEAVCRRCRRRSQDRQAGREHCGHEAGGRRAGGRRCTERHGSSSVRVHTRELGGAERAPNSCTLG